MHTSTASFLSISVVCATSLAVWFTRERSKREDSNTSKKVEARGTSLGKFLNDPTLLSRVAASHCSTLKQSHFCKDLTLEL